MSIRALAATAAAAAAVVAVGAGVLPCQARRRLAARPARVAGLRHESPDRARACGRSGPPGGVRPRERFGLGAALPVHRRVRARCGACLRPVSTPPGTSPSRIAGGTPTSIAGRPTSDRPCSFPDRGSRSEACPACTASSTCRSCRCSGARMAPCSSITGPTGTASPRPRTGPPAARSGRSAAPGGATRPPIGIHEPVRDERRCRDPARPSRTEPPGRASSPPTPSRARCGIAPDHPRGGLGTGATDGGSSLPAVQ